VFSLVLSHSGSSSTGSSRGSDNGSSYSNNYVTVMVFTACSELQKVLFLAPSVCGFSVCVFLLVYEISPELLNRFAPNSHGRRVWSLAQMSSKVKGQGPRSPGTKNSIFRPF